MAVGNEILEKPDKLTDDEFSKMKNHAGYTYLILSEVNDFEEIRDWAAFHHEKLNGKGYPFGKTAAELNEPERIMACIDIYQALTEDRPYKKGLSHEKRVRCSMTWHRKVLLIRIFPRKLGNVLVESNMKTRKYRKFLRNAFTYYE